MLISAIIPTFCDADRAIALVYALSGQSLPRECNLEIIVVDDGSGDGSSERLRSGLQGTATLISLPLNLGRAGARTRGITEANGDFLLLIDCDCLPVSTDLIRLHLGALAPEVVASIGPVEGDGRGFWHRYQLDASSHRIDLFNSGISYSGTTANMMVRRRAFDEAAGFSEAYKDYGFEDRDLLLKLNRFGRIAWATGATVRHMDELSLAKVSRKLEATGRVTSTVFMSDHPDAYRALGYASIDTRMHPALKPLAWLSGRLIRPATAFLDPLLERLPYPIAKVMVKLVGAGAYLHGTYQADRAGN